MITKNVYNRRRRRAFQIGSIKPDASYVTNMPPSSNELPNIVDLNCKFVHISTNKSKHAIHAIKWTPDARRVLVSSFSGEFTIWNGLNFSFESIMQAHDFPISSLQYSHNGKWLISGDQSGCIKYWQPNFNNVNILNKSHENSVNELSFSPNDFKFVSGSDDQTLKIWDFSSAKEENILKGHHWDVKSCDWHSSLGLIVSGSKDNLVKLWDPRDGSCITTLHDFKHTVSKTSFQKGGNERLLAACSRDHSTRIFDLRMLRCLTIIKSENEADLTSLSWHPIHSTMLTVGAYDGSLSHYNINKTADIETINTNNVNNNENNDNNNNDNETKDLTKQINKLKNGNKTNEEIENYVYSNIINRGPPIINNALHSIPFAHDKAIQAIEYHPLGHMLCTAGADKSMRFWGRSRPNDEESFKDNAHLGPESEKKMLDPVPTLNEPVKNDEPFILPGLSNIPGFGT